MMVALHATPLTIPLAHFARQTTLPSAPSPGPSSGQPRTDIFVGVTARAHLDERWAQMMRSRAWLFSSLDSPIALAGRFIVSPTPGLKLTNMVVSHSDLQAHAPFIRPRFPEPPARLAHPLDRSEGGPNCLATTNSVQCVTSSGGSALESANTSATVRALRRGMPGVRAFLQSRPFTRLR